MNSKRFRVAFSFAGEKRDFVAKVAAILATEFGKKAILYDKYHEAEFARRDLGIYLPELYHKRSDLIVVVLCKAYDEKQWTGLEWTAIHDLLSQREADEVMLSRFDHATVGGLYSTAGFVELDQKTPEDTAGLILERLAALDKRCKDEEAGAGDIALHKPLSTSIANNLPRLLPFFGREKELAAIREALDPASRTWGALIDGPGGMGKTSLAIRAAYDCSVAQFERIVFVSVKDREMDDDGVRRLTGTIIPSFVEMLNELAGGLEKADITKAAEDQRIRLLLDAIRDTRTLLILDNLESLTKVDRDQVFTFVKRLPQGCKAILTSRRRIGSSADTLILEKLEEPAALETLADLARHNPLLAKTSKAERIALYAQTGGKPLLLRWVAGQLGRGSCRTFTDALRFLSTCPPENDPLEFIFGDLATEFTRDEERVLVALAYFTLPAKVEHIATIAGLDGELVETALDTLANRSLVVPDQEEKRYTLVPMVAEFLRKHRPEVVRETGDRLEERAYALIIENGYYEHDRFPVLDAAWPTLAPALPLFLAGPNPRLQTICEAVDFFLSFTGRWDERLSLNERAEAKAVANGDHYHAGWRADRAGRVYSRRDQADAVLECAERAGAHWHTAKAGARERALAINLRGLGYNLKKDYPATITAHQEALLLLQSVSAESDDVALALNALAVAEENAGDFADAERDYRGALQIARAVDNAEMVAGIPSGLAGLALAREDWSEAERLAREALPLVDAVGRQELIASNHHRLALALLNQRKAAEAIPHVRLAIQIYTTLGSPSLTAARALLAQCEEEAAAN